MGKGKRDLHHDDYRLSLSPLAQSAYVRPRKDARKREKGELLRHTPRETGDSARARARARVAEGKQGMFVVRVIWPIKPRGGARSTPASPFADR